MRDAIQTGLVWGVALALLALPAAAPGAVFPCSLAGFGAALAAGGGPHALDCSAADTITVPEQRVLMVQGDLSLDLGGVTIGFEGLGRARLDFAPTVTCAPDCVRGATTARIGRFTLHGGIGAHTTTGYTDDSDPPGSIDATVHDAVIRPPPNVLGGISLGGPGYWGLPARDGVSPAVSLHLLDSVLEGSYAGISVDGESRVTIERSLVTDTQLEALRVGLAGSARIVNSTFSDNSPYRATLTPGGALELESSTIVAGAGGMAMSSNVLVVTLGNQRVSYCGDAIATMHNALIEGSCGFLCGHGFRASLGGNIESGGDTCSLTHPTDQANVTPEALALGPLTQGLGPTPTHPLLPGSVAIDAAADCAVTEDQRGVPRPQGAACDAGAHELEAGLELAIDVLPGIEPNPIDPFAPDAIPVAILGSDLVDAESVLAASLSFGPAGARPLRTLCEPEGDAPQREEPSGDCAALFLADVNGDGLPDLVSHYRSAETGIAHGQSAACLAGELWDATPVRGCDAIQTPPACGLGFELALLLPPLAWCRRQLRRTR